VHRVDDYHGVRIADPFRWLENRDNPATARWMAAQNALTSEYLSQLPHRAELRRRLGELADAPRYSRPIVAPPYLLFTKNAGLEDQGVLYRQHERGGDPDVVLDPNTTFRGQPARLTDIAPSRDAKYLALGVAPGGGDWEEYYVLELASNRRLPDRLNWLMTGGIAWCNGGFFYSRYPAPSGSDTPWTQRGHHQVWYHKVNTPQAADVPIYRDPRNPQRFHWATTTQDERFTVLSTSDPASGYDGNGLSMLQVERRRVCITPLVDSFNASLRVIGSVGGRLVVLTNWRAPRWRLILIDPADPLPHRWETLIPEHRQRLEQITSAGGKLFAVYRHRGAHRVSVFDLAGNREHEIDMPGIGSVEGFEGRSDAQSVFWTFSGFVEPPAVYRYDIASRKSTLFWDRPQQIGSVRYQMRRVFFTSKDGTRVPMHIVAKRGVRLNGRNLALIQGYGGFGVSVGPSFNLLLVPLLERGVIYALPSVRGGGEYGQRWHRQGSLRQKQNSFDDFISALEWLQQRGYTSKARCAIQGRSNGGLLVGAVMTQRPDLCRVALLSVPVLDMLRYQYGGIAYHWAVEYGSSKDPDMLPVLLGYSPLHNIASGVRYPATLTCVVDGDERVPPWHSYKFTAALQESGHPSNPYLIRIDRGSGHGPLAVRARLDEAADAYAFMLDEILKDDRCAAGRITRTTRFTVGDHIEVARRRRLPEVGRCGP
jgi:prolyl oligopeptidase